jgi:hypothetical protein
LGRSRPLTRRVSRLGLALTAERAERIVEQALDLPKALSDEIAFSTERVESGAKEIDRCPCPHRFPMLRDAKCGECVSCSRRTFRVLRVPEPLRLGVHPVGSCIHSEAGFGTKGSQVRILSPRLRRPRCLSGNRSIAAFDFSGTPLRAPPA